MKKIIKRIFVLLLICLLIASAVWYMFVYDRNTVRDLLVELARTCAAHDNYDGATWFYDLSYKMSEDDRNVAIELADIYKSVGNYTKAEYTLSNAIADGGSTELYVALCKTYVEQDKLLDAVNMLDNISDPSIKEEIENMRPAAPEADFAPGFYNQYISLSLNHDGGSLYVSTDGEYPTTSSAPVVDPITLNGGETKVYAITVGNNGLVSPLSILNYTIGGVIEKVELADPAVESVLRGELMFGQDTEIHTDDLWTIKEFTVPAEASSLEDLAYLTQLRKLTIADQTISSFSFLSGMSHLEELIITNCSVSDTLELVAGLPALQRLTISGTTVSSVSELSSASGLVYLDLSGNAIGDISPLSSMSVLETLDLSNNAVTDLSPLSGLPQLSSVYLSHNVITSMAPLGTCANLTHISLGYNKIDAVTAVDQLSNLTELNLNNNALTDIGVLSSNSSLQILDLSNNALTDISGLSSISTLTELNVAHNQIATLPEFPDGVGIVRLNAQHNQLTDVSALSHLTKLNYINMDYNENLDNINALLDCPDLVQVDIYGTKVSSTVANKLTDRSVIVNYDPTA